MLIPEASPSEIIASATTVYIKSNFEVAVNTNFLGQWKDMKTNMTVNMSTTATEILFIMAVMDI